MPYEIWNAEGGVNSYMHLGQHGKADYQGLIQITTPATKEEFKDLKKELENNGYMVEVIKKFNRTKYLSALAKVRLNR